jgi:uncharacterized membrane protein
MESNRLEAFSDGVLAIIITIMVLELKVPHGTDWAVLQPLLPILLTYVLSFIYVGIYWNNHHHLFKACESVNGAILWANLHLLFWLSMFPLVTGWMGENHFAPLPTAAYGFVLLMAAFAYYLLERAIIRQQGPESLIAKALGAGWKEAISTVCYLAAIPLVLASPWFSDGLFVFVASLWVVPDRRLEEAITAKAALADREKE